MTLCYIDDAREDPTEMKKRIMRAYFHGLLDADEAEEWIVLRGLVAA